MDTMKDIFKLNKQVSGETDTVIYVFWIATILLAWGLIPGIGFIPRPQDILKAWFEVYTDHNLLGELFLSFKLFLMASGISIIIALGLAYGSVIPFVKGLVDIISKFRFFSMYGFSLIFLMMSVGAVSFKVSLLVFSMVGYLVTAYASMVSSVKEEELNYARTLGLTEPKIVWHVIINGRKHEVVEIFRQNSAMIWMMLSAVEGYVVSAGGVGAMLFNQYRMMRFDRIFAVQLTIFAIGICIDALLRYFVKVFFPYARAFKGDR